MREAVAPTARNKRDFLSSQNKTAEFSDKRCSSFLRQPLIGCQISLSDWGWCISGEVLMLLAAAKNSRPPRPDWPAAVDLCIHSSESLKRTKSRKTKFAACHCRKRTLTFYLGKSKGSFREDSSLPARQLKPPLPRLLLTCCCLSPRRGNAQSLIEAEEVRAESKDKERLWGEIKKEACREPLPPLRRQNTLRLNLASSTQRWVFKLPAISCKI